MVSKVTERIFAESAARLLGLDWELIDIEEPVDFEVRTKNDVFGLEVRQIFIERELNFGSASKRGESENKKILSKLANLYSANGGPPAVVKVLGPLGSISNNDFVAEIALRCPTFPNPGIRIECGDVTVYVSPLPLDHVDRTHWHYVEDRVGWLRSVTSDQLQRAVDRKQSNLPLYLQKYGAVELLLVADRTFNSGRMSISDELKVSNPGFRAIYFLSYPDGAARVD